MRWLLILIACSPAGADTLAPGAVFEYDARLGTTLYVRTAGGACDAWTLAGDRSGTITRAGIAMPLAFTLDGDTLVASGDSSRRATAPGMLPAELCRDRLALGADTSSGFAVGDGTWYFGESECKKATAPPPKSCMAAVANVYRAAKSTADPVKALRRASAIYVIDGRSCATWTFRGKHLESRGTSYGFTFDGNEIELDGPSESSAQGTLGIGSFDEYTLRAGPADAVVLVSAPDRAHAFERTVPWFLTKPACERVLAAATSP